MVWISRTLFFAQKKPIRRYLRNKFIDSLRLHVVGGTGGTGLPKYGGIGGQGGCVYCVGKEGMTLNELIRKYPEKKVKAKHGEDSKKKQIIGTPGADEILEVPVGISIYSENKQLGEINLEGETCILARGGPGGDPKNNFLGFEGQNRTVVLDLKLIADVGFVGFPNAGKSTLLKALSRAKPKIASYPFTTIRPNLGIMEYPDMRRISLADLPGLIEGAHINIGMGHNFLKHVERTKLLLLIADIQGFQLSHQHVFRSCLETIVLLNKELELYDPDLLNKPAILALNKMDTANAEEKYIAVRKQLENPESIRHLIEPEICPNQFIRFEEIIGISADKNGDDVKYLKESIRTVMDLSEETSQDEAVNSIKEKLVERGPKLT